MGYFGNSKGSIMKISRVTKVCQHCSKEFTVQTYRKDTAHFCSRACHYAHRNFGKTEENERARKSQAYKNWRKSVFERDNYTCVSCGHHGGDLQADHIQPFAYFPELRFELSNGRTLCVPCHKETETFGFKAWRKVVI